MALASTRDVAFKNELAGTIMICWLPLQTPPSPTLPSEDGDVVAKVPAATGADVQSATGEGVKRFVGGGVKGVAGAGVVGVTGGVAGASVATGASIDVVVGEADAEVVAGEGVSVVLLQQVVMR